MNFLFAGIFVFTFSTIALAASWHDQSAREDGRDDCACEERRQGPPDPK